MQADDLLPAWAAAHKIALALSRRRDDQCAQRGHVRDPHLSHLAWAPEWSSDGPTPVAHEPNRRVCRRTRCGAPSGHAACWSGQVGCGSWGRLRMQPFLDAAAGNGSIPATATRQVRRGVEGGPTEQRQRTLAAVRGLCRVVALVASLGLTDRAGRTTTARGARKIGRETYRLDCDPHISTWRVSD